MSVQVDICPNCELRLTRLKAWGREVCGNCGFDVDHRPEGQDDHEAALAAKDAELAELRKEISSARAQLKPLVESFNVELLGDLNGEITQIDNGIVGLRDRAKEAEDMTDMVQASLARVVRELSDERDTLRATVAELESVGEGLRTLARSAFAEGAVAASSQDTIDRDWERSHSRKMLDILPQPSAPEPCGHCRGSGGRFGDPCHPCEGSGVEPSAHERETQTTSAPTQEQQPDSHKEIN